MQWAWPWAFSGLLSIPALVIIYRLLGRSEPRVVSSLFLWHEARPVVVGGQRLQKFQKPLLFFLELLMLLILVVAAAAPHLEVKQLKPPLIVVLDNSYSMLAGAPNSRDQAIKILSKILAEEEFPQVRYILAGEEATAFELEEHQSISDRWTCQETRGDLEQGIRLARSLSRSSAQILVLTDRAPRDGEHDQLLDWKAFGKVKNNLAIVTATREGPRCLVEVANFSNREQRTRLKVGPTEQALTIAANSKQRLILQVPEVGQALELSLPEDGLSVDNRVWLMPERQVEVRVALAVGDEALAALLKRTFRVIEGAALVDTGGDILVTDGPMVPEGRRWILQIAASKGEPFAGPFLSDARHPLTEGLSLPGSLWVADPTMTMGEYRPLLTVGDIPLLSVISERTASFERRLIRMNFELKGSRLQETRNWPILMDNLIRWRMSEEAGPRTMNLRLGEDLNLVLKEQGTLSLTNPRGERQDMMMNPGVLSLPLDGVGLHQIEIGTKSWQVSLNALSPDESDLRATHSGTWLRAETSPVGDQAWESMVSPLLWLLVALALVHQILVSRLRGGRP